MTVKGIDVSQAQGSSIDWAAVRNSGVAFAYVKLTEADTGIDSRGRVNASDAHHAGLMVGAYHYAYPAGNPVQQANHFFQQAKDLPLDLPYALDLEAKSGLGPAAIIAFAEAFVTRLKELTGGADVVLYTYPSFAKEMGAALLNSEILRACLLWIADYGANTLAVTSDPSSPYFMPGWEWVFRQISGDKGPLTPGISVVTDRNIYRGTESELRNLRAVGGPTIGPPRPGYDLLGGLGKWFFGGLGLVGAGIWAWKFRHRS